MDGKTLVYNPFKSGMVKKAELEVSPVSFMAYNFS